MSLPSNTTSHLQLVDGGVATCPAAIAGPRIVLKPISHRYADHIFQEFTQEIALFMNPAPAREIAETCAFIDTALAQRTAGTDFIFVI
jgi:hypothetical protein